MTTATQLILDIRESINDETAPYRWSDATLLRYINAGQRQIVMLVPEANAVETRVTTAVGARQVIPALGVKFIRASSNYNGVTSLRTGALRYIERDAMDTHWPGWESEAAAVTPGTTANTFQHYLHDPREPTVFYLYPAPQTGTEQVYIVYSAIPATLTVVGDNLGLAAVYENALVDYCVYRALSKEGRYSMPHDKTEALWNRFLRALGLKTQSDARVSVQNHKPPEGP